MKKLLFALIASACLHFSANAQDYMFNIEAASFATGLRVTDNTVNINVTTLYGGAIVPGKSAIYPLAGTSFTGVFYTCSFWDMPSGLGALWVRFGGDGQTITISNSSILVSRHFATRIGIAATQQTTPGVKNYNFIISETYVVPARGSITVPVPAFSVPYYNNLPFGFVAPLNAGSLVLFQIVEGV